ncbi:condensation domain-containing protein [Corynebacterium flavescens]|uniref:condensation domain-containing protein n=1 Tax=Corynebacterium flavescens TaxID=28028 RepID=UPI0026483970|nr:condensation domain-containing protein [Corynebacterium flavescens]MDN6688151.1 condensation domain-containing protein [Corynebacterium flavescens]
MRLTHVTHLRLPFGPLRSYHVTVEPTGTRSPVSFDQARHVSAGNRPGSWMAMSMRLPAPVDRDRLAEAWRAVIERHGTLRTVFDHGPDGEVILLDTEVTGGEWTQHVARPGQSMRDLFREVLDTHCVSFGRPSYLLCITETAQRPTLVIASDHSHVDMWSMLVLVRDLLAELNGTELPAATPPPFAEHTRLLRNREPAPESIRQRWRDIIDAGGGVMPRFPLPLGEPGHHPERVEVREVFTVDDIATFAAHARLLGVSTLALTISLMAAVTRERVSTPLRALFPVHSRFDREWHDSVGWFITNSILEVNSSEPGDAADAVKEAIRLGAWPLEDVLAPWDGMPDTPGMFAVSWLDLRRLPVSIDDIGLEAQYVSAAMRTDGVMVWFIIDDTGAHLRCRYPDTLEARENVGSWLDDLVGLMQDTARRSAGSQFSLGARKYRVQRAAREDLPAIIALLTPNPAPLHDYESAFHVMDINAANYLAVVRDEDDAIVGTMQLTIMPGLDDGGATRLNIANLAVTDAALVSPMLTWAHVHGAARGARAAQIITDAPEITAHIRASGYSGPRIQLERTL